jgi:hypothetical protein
MNTFEGARRIGLRGLGRFALRRLWSTSRALGLRARLDALPEARAAKIPVAMVATETSTFTGFDDELGRSGEDDSLEVLGRQRLCSGGVTTLYVASDDNGAPIYAQWLVTHDNQAALHAATGGLFPPLGQGEVLVEGAYTFIAFRKLGAMADALQQLLHIAHDAGAHSALTYVTDDNVPSLRGCARAGFDLDHVRLTTRRFGRRRSTRGPLDDDARAAWQRAIA